MKQFESKITEGKGEKKDGVHGNMRVGREKTERKIIKEKREVQKNRRILH